MSDIVINVQAAPIRIEVTAAQGPRGDGAEAIVKSANFTAANDYQYNAIATLTVTDPTGVEGAGYMVFVVDGTATVGGVPYATAGTVLRRVYEGGAWATYVYGEFTGNAATATALQTARTIAMTGDVTWTSPAFDGTANVTAAGTLATVNSNVGAFGSSTQTASLTVDAKGRVTAASQQAIAITSATTSDGTADLDVDTLTAQSSIYVSTSGLVGVNGRTSGGATAAGVWGFGTLTATGVLASSQTGTGLIATSATGDYHATFSTSASINSGFVARLRGAFGWFRGAFTGRIVSADTLTADRTWELPNASGNIVLDTNTVTLTNKTISGASNTITNVPISTGVSGLGSNVATFLATPSSANLISAITDETGSGSLVFSSSPTITTPTIAQINGNTTASGTLTLQSTTNATKGKILFGTSAYDEVNNRLGIGTASPSNPLHIVFSSSDAGLNAAHITNSNTLGKSILNLTNNAGTTIDVGVFGATFPEASLAGKAAIAASGGFTLFTDGGVSSGGTSPMIFATGGYVASTTERMRITSTGSILVGTTTENTKAILNLTSTTRGFLPPRMTTAQRDAITSVPAGLMIYNTTTNKLNVYTTAWEVITSA